MNLEQLRSFRAVAQEGGFSRAADALFLTQSTVSMQVATLERELGVKLFHRMGRRVVLSHAGESMLGYAGRILSQVDESRKTMASFRGLAAGELLVGASLTIGSYLLPELFGRFHKLHEGVRLLVDIAPTPRQVEQIVSGKMDLGLVEGPVGSPELVVEPFFIDQLALIVPPEHRWVGRSSVAVEELQEEPFLEREPTSGTREIVHGRLAEYGIELKPVLELGSPEALKRAVRAGLGVAIVSRATLELELRTGLLVSLHVSGVELTRPFYTVVHKDRYVSPPLAAFLELLHATYIVERSQ
ncbi:MAG TPA: LysR family transcriptional regulator [Chloroflexota bacterium]|nr:LysR family transcriptional regulator [Chloroflexota bacterium]